MDFDSLLSNPDLTTRYEINTRPSETGQPASLVLEPTTKSKCIKTISDWLRIFHIFVSIYTQKSPHESHMLMKYGQMVQDLAARGHNWFYYDENVRFLRQKLENFNKKKCERNNTHLINLQTTIRSCGVSFDIWQKN